jgi:hypothetical protein
MSLEFGVEVCVDLNHFDLFWFLWLDHFSDRTNGSETFHSEQLSISNA